MSKPSTSCPLPDEPDRILLAHGSGGRKTERLIRDVFLAEFRGEQLGRRLDAAPLTLAGQRTAITTDSYVVDPLFFPGGDIGKLAVLGTLNDLAMVGARPVALTAGFILEEGLGFEPLRRIARSMARCCQEVGVPLVAGDTKVVDRGRGDGVYINTTGLGELDRGLDIGPEAIRTGDVLIVSGDVGRHGMAVLSARQELGFEGLPDSDCAWLGGAVSALLADGIVPHCLRDLTRGGLGAALNELAASASARFEITASDVPVDDAVRGACELLGIDPFYVACEGRFVLFVDATNAARALSLLREIPVSSGARIIGQVTGTETRPSVELLSELGTRRVLDWLSAEQLPRIC